MEPWRWIPLLFCTLCLIPTVIQAQGSKADYKRADQLKERFSGKVFQSTIKPYWLTDNTRFWYRNDLPGGAREFVLVDALDGSRDPAFDHSKIAAILSHTNGPDFRATHLPVERLSFSPNGKAVTLDGADQWWRIGLETYELLETGTNGSDTAEAVRILDSPRATRRTGEETSVRFVNRSRDIVQVYWMDSRGDEVHYSTVKAGDRYDQHTFEGHVWLVKDPKGRLLEVFEAKEQAGKVVIDGKPKPRLDMDDGDRRHQKEPVSAKSPDGTLKAFLHDQNLYVRNLENGEEYALSTDGSEEDRYSGQIWWSPDSQRLVALRTKQGTDRKVHYIESSPDDQLQPKLHSYDYRKPGDEIPLSKPRLFDPRERRQIPVSDELFPNPWAITRLRWEPDSTAFTFLYNQRGHQVMRVISVDGESGRVRALVDEQSDTFFCYSSKTFLKHLPATAELIWMSERDGWNHLFLYDTETGRLKNQITTGEWVVREVEHVDEQKRQVWFKTGGILPGQDPYHVHYARVNFDGTGLIVLTEEDGTHSIELSPDRKFFIDKWSRVDQAPTHELRRSSDGKRICRLEEADLCELAELGWQAPERFVAKGRDGVTDIYGIIIRPTNFDPDKSYPIVENIYAGPHGAFVPKSFSSYRRLRKLAELGFIVVKIDGMGTNHRSKRFHDVCWKNLGDSGFPDRIAWIKAAGARYPYMDLGRVGIYGGSAGGQSSTRGILMYPDFYRVAVSDCGCHDNRMDKIWWNEQWMGWPIGPHYKDQSNVTQAHRLEGKLLLIVGAMDENVDPASTMQVADALIKADKDFDLLVIPDAGHGAAETDYGERRRADYFVRHLLHVKPRWEP